MEFLLKLKPWRLLLLFWSPTLFLVTLAILNVVHLPYNYYVLILFVVPYAWNWSITLNFHRKLHGDIRMSTRKYKLLLPLGFFFFCMSMLSMTHVDAFVAYYNLIRYEGTIIVTVLICFFFGFLFTLWGTGFSARVLKSVWVGKPVTYSESEAEWIQILLCLMGVGTIQPIIKRLVEGDEV